MIPVRKLTFQLTPLLDLLLIVFFAQHLEVRTVVRQESNRRAAAQETLSAERDEALRQLAALKERLSAHDELNAERQALARDFRRMQAQRDLIGEMVVELFRVPESVVDAVVHERTAVAPGPTAEEMRRLKEQLRRLADERGAELVDHLLTFHELRKRCDLWEVYIQGDGQIVFSTGTQRHVLRAEEMDAFAARLFDAYKALPQPKSLVLILVSYGDARLGVRQAVLDGLPTALDRIRADDEGRSRFDYAVLGYRPHAPQEPQP
jgi:hypothetical protein